MDFLFTNIISSFNVLEVLGFVTIVALALGIDLKSHKEDKPITTKNALLWSCVWVAVSLAFAGYIGLTHGSEDASMFLSGYFLEKSLSVDNLFVFMAIFASFGISDKYQHRILYYGIFGAIVLRIIFVGFGAALAALSHWVLVGFGLIVLYSAYAMWKGKEDKEVDYSKHAVIQYTTKFFTFEWTKYLVGKKNAAKISDKFKFGVHPAIDNHDFFTKKNGVWMMTPLFLCLVVVELSDVIFAVDSVPAVIAITQDQFLVITSNIFAILGLRSLYFLLADAKQCLCHLEKAVIAILGFIGIKMIATVAGFHISPNISLGIVLGTLTLGVAASFLFPEKAEA